MAQDFGINLIPRLRGDATAAAGIARRRGAGNIRHIDIRTLWLQRHITQGSIQLLKENGKELAADLGTKALSQAEIDKHLAFLGFYFASGRSSKALSAAI